ncbi:Rgg/GadR/MutR family transcriptional regulator [Streptococcus himalayensis]|uniref:Transcriptional regulator n=1 Tax=Streptococcus himalayensis TaxID=1888195 RepID=A0A917EG92_9STRE|nr:Rgg/GadR/MutR family transcriptional regulator [Streptococcus himalayensis]GGE30298.1 transcriptional regulator [Streptococcus himalayensis]
MEELGAMFRKFRLNGQFTLEEAAGETLSVSQLSRFERGESDLVLGKFLPLLDNIHITMENFMDAVRGFQKPAISQFITTWVKLYYQKDIEGLRALQAEELELYKRYPEQYYHRLNMILLQGLMCQRNPSLQIAQSDLDLVSDYLFQVEEWSMYEMILIGNLYSFYEVDYVYRIGREILEREDFYQHISRHKELVIVLALNFWLHAAEQKEFEKAEYFEQQARRLLKDTDKIFEKTILLYVDGFTAYQKGQELAGIVQMKRAMSIFEWTDTPHQVTYYQEHFDRFVVPDRDE